MGKVQVSSSETLIVEWFVMALIPICRFHALIGWRDIGEGLLKGLRIVHRALAEALQVIAYLLFRYWDCLEKLASKKGSFRR